MKISERTGHSMRWHQPRAMEQRYVLECEGETLATLSFRSAFGTMATGESAEGTWTFKRVGFFQSRVTVREAGADRDLAVFQPATWSQGGTATLADGRALKMTTNFWQTRIELLDTDDEPLMRVRVGGLMHLAADVELLPAAATLAELPWLLMLACYLIVNMQRDATVAVVAIC